MPEFTPYESAVGGVMIGLAAGTTLLTHGRIAGISGILNGLLQRRPDADTAWRACFIAGVVSGAASNKFLNPIEKDKLAAEFSLPFGAAQVGLAGLAVGAGTRLGNGCTSGHGICGLGRFSRRSAAAVTTFMSVGVLTAVAMDRAFGQHAPPPADSDGAGASSGGGRRAPPASSWSLAPLRHRSDAFPVLALVASAGALAATAFGRLPLANSFAAGSTFGLGLTISGMTHQDKVVGFLNVAGAGWDPSLAFVMGGGLLVSAASYRLFRSRAMQPLLQQCHALPTRTDIDAQLLGGSALFGAGWALGGFCPGPAVASLGTGLVGGPTFASAALFVGSFAVGSKLAQAGIVAKATATPTLSTASNSSPGRPGV